MLYLVAFILALFDDVLAASYIKSVNNKPIRAAVISSMIVLFGNTSVGIAVPEYNWWLVPFEMFGAAAGTYIVARRSKDDV